MLAGDLIKKIRKIEITTRRAVNDILAGQYRSVFKGRGMAFDEVRPYQPGDDIRVIDWNVTARMNELHVKQFIEERELTVMLLMDASGSQYFGSRIRFKNELMAELAGLLAFSAIKNNDRVGLIIFTDQVELFTPPKKGAKHVLRVISEILSFSPKHRQTDLACGLRFLSNVTKHKSVAFLASDFMASNYDLAIKVANRRHDLVPLVLRDPLEHILPKAGWITFQDLENSEQVLIDTGSKTTMNAVTRNIHAIWENQRRLFRQLGMDYVELFTDRDYVTPLVKLFRLRSARMSR